VNSGLAWAGDVRPAHGAPVRCRLWTTPDGFLWFAVAVRDGWSACWKLGANGGRPEVVELRVVPTPPGDVVHVDAPDRMCAPVGHHAPPGGGLRAATWRSEVVVGTHVFDLLPKALRRAAAGPVPAWSSVFAAYFGALGFSPSEPPRRGSRGPAGRGDAYYVRLAADYVAACESGSDSPVKDVAKARRTRPAKVSQDLHRARRRGLLTEVMRGVPGGELTPRARTILTDESTKKRR
jgi:hypothetical protein